MIAVSTLKLSVQRDVTHPMRDGVLLAFDIYRPESGSPVPAILEMTPYHKDVVDHAGRDVRYRHFAERGYACVICDIRGTGNSEGVNHAPFMPEEIEDGCELVEWLSRQEWCNGAIGMWGISYTGIICFQVAKRRPKGLKAIIACQAPQDLYEGWLCPGGALRPYLFEQYAPLMTAFNCAPPSRASSSENWQERWVQRMNEMTPWSLPLLDHLEDDAFWRERSLPPDYEAIECPTFMITGWADWYPRCLLDLYQRLQGPKRILVGPWGHSWPIAALPGPQIDDFRECMLWFDRWLKDDSQASPPKPPVSIFVEDYRAPSSPDLRAPGRFLGLDTWPPEDVETREYHLNPERSLDRMPPELDAEITMRLPHTVQGGNASGRYVIGQFPGGWGGSLDQRVELPHGIVFLSAPYPQEAVLIGVPELRLAIETKKQSAGYLAAKLLDIPPGSAPWRMISNAGRKLGGEHPDRSQGTKAFRMELSPLAYRVAVGHSIGLFLTTSDFQNAWPLKEESDIRIRFGPNAVSTLVLPDASNSPASDPDLVDAVSPVSHPAPAPHYEARTDLHGAKVSVGYSIEMGFGKNTSDLTVHSAPPGHACIESEFVYRGDEEAPGEDLTLRSTCSLESDNTHFHHRVTAEAHLSTKRVFSKTWTKSVKRTGF